MAERPPSLFGPSRPGSCILPVIDLTLRPVGGVHVHQAWLFVKRGIVMWLGYRTALLLGLVGSLVSLVQFGWTARFVAEGHVFPQLAPYGGDLVAYFLVGSAFTAYSGVALTAFQEHIRAEQEMGTLEALLVTGVPVPVIALYIGLWPLLYTLTNTALLFLCAAFLFHVPLRVHLLSTSLVVGLTVAGLSGVGLMSAGVVLVTKRGDPIHWGVTTVVSLLSGVFYPVEILPEPLQHLARLLPTTYGLHALRLSLLRGVGPTQIGKEMAVLLLTAAVTVSLGILAFYGGWTWARCRGTLAEY